jgi:hypothetical protein
LGIDDVKYYDVKTPTTSFVYHNAMKQGAALNSTYTQNVGKNFNFAVEYMGLRSQGFTEEVWRLLIISLFLRILILKTIDINFYTLHSPKCK